MIFCDETTPLQLVSVFRSMDLFCPKNMSHEVFFFFTFFFVTERMKKLEYEICYLWEMR